MVGNPTSNKIDTTPFDLHPNSARYYIVMSSTGSVLLYAKLESILASEINDGTLAVGDQLPTEDELIRRFDVSRITVRRATQNLVARGLVEIRRGKGTFVASPKITQELTELTGFVEDMKALGRNPSARLLEKTVVAADKTVADHLSSRKGSALSGFTASGLRMMCPCPLTKPISLLI